MIKVAADCVRDIGEKAETSNQHSFELPDNMSLISRLTIIKVSTAQLWTILPRELQLSKPSWKVNLRKSLRTFQRDTRSRERKFLFVMIFGEREKLFRFSRDYFMLPACTDLKKNRVCYFSSVLLTLVSVQKKKQGK